MRKTIEEIQAMQLTTCDEADEVAQWMADTLREILRNSQAAVSLYCLRRLGVLLSYDLSLRGMTPPLTLKVIDAATDLIRELQAAERTETTRAEYLVAKE